MRGHRRCPYLNEHGYGHCCNNNVCGHTGNAHAQYRTHNHYHKPSRKAAPPYNFQDQMAKIKSQPS